jgi:hypothetical protein
MAIFPIHNKHVVNYSVNASDNFTSGMALVIDSNGNAIKADRNNISYNSITEGFSKFIGFASGDHTNLSTILLSDPVGSNYIDSNNKFVDNTNSHYSASKRAIQDFKDESVSGVLFSEYSKRGVGVYNLQGEIYITDQFARVESSFIDIDGSTTIDFNVGDLLTFGAGVNAGKLVKVDTSAIGPSVLIIGVVEKFEAASNLLYFRHALETFNNTVSLYTTGITLFLDASNPTSYSGSGTTWYDLSGNGLNASLNNGASWNNSNGGVFQLDGSDDNISIPHNNLLNLPGDFTIEIIYNSQEPELQAIIGKRGGSLNNGDWNIASFYGASYASGARTVDWNNLAFTASVYLNGTIPVFLNKWYTITFTRIGNVKTSYINGIFSGSVIDSANFTNPYPIEMSRWAGNYTQATIASVKIWNNFGLSPSQIRQNYNATMGRLL